MRVTISGPPGSGKTTVCQRLSELLRVECVISGTIFRQMAREHELSLAEFGRLAEGDPMYDRELDERMVEIARENEDIILEGRLTAHMLSRNDIPAFRIYLDADVDERAMRVAKREDLPLEEAREMIVTRERSEATRYLAYYDIDIGGRSIYDLVVNTTSIPAEEVADRIVAKLEEIT